MDRHPLVSVIIPGFNAAAYIAEAICSAENQTYRNVEIIVVDDGSTDDTVGIVRRCGAVTLIEQAHAGAPAARNRGIAESRGIFVKFLDADDMLVETAIEQQVEAAAHLQAHEIPYGNYAILGETGLQEFGNAILHDADAISVAKVDLLTTAPLYRRSHLVEIGGFDMRLRRGQEWNLNVRLAHAGKRFRYQPVNVYIYRDHDAASRISNAVKNPGYATSVRFDQLVHTYDSLKPAVDSPLHEFFAGQLWFLGRFALRNDDQQMAGRCFEAAVAISPEHHLKTQPFVYQALRKVLGARWAEKVWVAMRRVAVNEGVSG